MAKTASRSSRSSSAPQRDGKGADGKRASRKKARAETAAAEAPPTGAERTLRYHHYCNVKPSIPRQYRAGLPQGRVSAINSLNEKWVNGTVLHYCFFDKKDDGSTLTLADGSTRFVGWKGGEAQKKVVRAAFKAWKALGIGLEFMEVEERTEAEIRIGFMQGDGSWSYVGRDVLGIGSDERTMNFGWDLREDLDTALHEIGHTLGFHHEHQNPFAGIVWDEPKVYAALAAPPNRWTREMTHWNIIRKLPEGSVQGTQWDPDSVMHYPFTAGLILEPEKYRTEPLVPAGGLSAHDKAWVLQIYPPLGKVDTYPELKLLESRPLRLKPGEQLDLRLQPQATRYYEMRTFGPSDSVMVLFEEVDGELRYRSGDDDSGEDRNTYMRVKLAKGRRYVLRTRLYYSDRTGETAVMWW